MNINLFWLLLKNLEILDAHLKNTLVTIVTMVTIVKKIKQRNMIQYRIKVFFFIIDLYILAEGRPSVDFCSRVAFPNRETMNEIKTIFEFISIVDCTLVMSTCTRKCQNSQCQFYYSETKTWKKMQYRKSRDFECLQLKEKC